MDINTELVSTFLQDPLLWNNLQVVLEHVANEDPIRLAKLNAQITSWTLIALEKRQKNKQFALSQLYMAYPNKGDPYLFFEMFYASKELYPIPNMVLSDCTANKDNFRLFVQLYRSQGDLSSWRKHYDSEGWLSKLDAWLATDEAKKFMEN